MADLTTIELIQKEKVETHVLPPPAELAHRMSLEKITHREDPVLKQFRYEQYKQEFLDAYIAQKFQVMVSPSIITRFKYAAMVRQAGRWEDISFKRRKLVFAVHDEKGKGLLYSGDIPDFALDRIKHFDEIREYAARFTIHSNELLPVTKFEPLTVFRKLDPVILGWLNFPYIKVTERGCILEGSYHSSYMIGGSYLDFPQPFVIAVWDNDKELEI